MTENSEIPMGKMALRVWARERRSRIDIAEVSSGVARQIGRLSVFQHARHILLYLALPDEINVESVIHSGRDETRLWYVPRCAPRRQLAIHTFDPLVTVMQSGPFGIREPDPKSSPEIDPWQIDLALIPGLLYTPNGARLGNGGGYYDRFLPRLSPRCVVVGVCAEALLVTDLPNDPWDIAVPSVVTETAVYSKSSAI